MSDLGPLFDTDPWIRVRRCDGRARRLADRHYSRQTPGAQEFMASGKTLVLLSRDALSVWGAIENMDPAGGLRWRVSIFRREGGQCARLTSSARPRTGRSCIGAVAMGPSLSSR